jgi:hypothetical protein
MSQLEGLPSGYPFQPYRDLKKTLQLLQEDLKLIVELKSNLQDHHLESLMASSIRHHRINYQPVILPAASALRCLLSRTFATFLQGESLLSLVMCECIVRPKLEFSHNY